MAVNGVEVASNLRSVIKSLFKDASGTVKRLGIVLILPAIISAFDPLLGFAVFLILLEKFFLSMLSFPGLEFTTLATLLFGMKYGVYLAVALAFLVPGILVSIIKFTMFWEECVGLAEPPINIGFGNVLDMVSAFIAASLKGYDLLLVMLVILVTKHALNFLKNKLTKIESFDVAAVVVSSTLNLLLIILFHEFWVWLIHA